MFFKIIKIIFIIGGAGTALYFAKKYFTNIETLKWIAFIILCLVLVLIFGLFGGNSLKVILRKPAIIRENPPSPHYAKATRGYGGPGRG